MPAFPSLRRWRTPAVLAAVLLAATGAWLVSRDGPPPEERRADAARFMSELMSGTVPIGGPFTLKDAYGKPRSLADFRGRLVLLYFGFTYCPDICPTDLLVVGEAVKRAGAEHVQPVFVTLDPERDTPEMLRGYVASFHPAFVALTGTEAEVRAVANAYKVFFEKVRSPGSSAYAIDHMAFTFLLDRQGKYVGTFPTGTSAERMLAVIREVSARGD